MLCRRGVALVHRRSPGRIKTTSRPREGPRSLQSQPNYRRRRTFRITPHAVSMALPSKPYLGPHIVGTLGRRCRGARRRVVARLTHRPLMALVLVLRLLVGCLTILRVRDQFAAASPGRRRARRLHAPLLFKPFRRSDGLVLLHVRVISVVGVISVVVRHAAPPIRLVVQRQGREVQPETQTAPTPTPAAAAPAAAPAVAAMPAAIAAVPAAIATPIAAAIGTATVAAVPACAPAGKVSAAAGVTATPACVAAAAVLRDRTSRHSHRHRERAEENGDLSYQVRTLHNVTRS